MIPVDAATAAGVLVANVPGVNARTVAEYVLFTATALLRRFRAVDRDLRTQGWLAAREQANFGADLGGRTIGIVGMGSIGWMLVLAAAMAAEKNLPWGARLRTPLGVALLTWGLGIAVANA